MTIHPRTRLFQKPTNSPTSSGVPMDATRADVEFTAQVCAVAIEEGATLVRVGRAIFGEMIKDRVDDVLKKLEDE